MENYINNESAAKLAEIEAKANELAKTYNDQYGEKKFDEAAKTMDLLDEQIGEYTAEARKAVFAYCKAAEDPMLAAVKILEFDVIAKVNEKTELSKVPILKIGTKKKPIDIGRLHAACKDGIGKDPKWIYKLEQFNARLTARKAKDLGLDPTEVLDSFEMASISKAISLGKDPVSNTQLLNTMKNLVADMIGDEYKPTSHDVAYLRDVYSKKGKKALTVATANNKALRGIMLEICHKLVEKKAYELDYKKAKA